MGLLAPAQLFDARWTLGDRLRLGAAAAADWRSHLDRITSASVGDRVQFVRRRVRGAARRVRRLVGLADTLAVELDEFINMVEYPEDCKEVAETHWKATVAYRIQPYAGQITAFDCPPHTQFRGARIRCAWEGVARGRIRWVDVSGTHGTMMHSPHVEVLADAIWGELDRLPS